MQNILQSPISYLSHQSNNELYQRVPPSTLQLSATPVVGKAPRILVIDSAKSVRDILRLSLERVGYQVLVASSGKQGLQLFAQAAPINLVLVETIMPDIDGFTFCAKLRQYSHVPIVLLSERNHIDQVVYGFSMGADDYMTKPFVFPILYARLQAILRRAAIATQVVDQQVIAIDEIVLNDDLRAVSVRNQPVSLSPTEYGLLRYLMHMVDRPVSKQELFQNVWGYPDNADVNLVRVSVHRLREKIEENPTQPTHVLTVPGFGYKFQTLQSAGAN